MPYIKTIPPRQAQGNINVPPGGTPLYRAVRAVDLAAVKLLVDRGARPGMAIKDGSTPVMAAAGLGAPRGGDEEVTEAGDRNDPVDVLKVLVEKGADVNAVNDAGMTALHYAAQRGSDRIIQYLADQGAKFDVKNKQGRTVGGLRARPHRRPGGGVERRAGPGGARPAASVTGSPVAALSATRQSRAQAALALRPIVGPRGNHPAHATSWISTVAGITRNQVNDKVQKRVLTGGGSLVDADVVSCRRVSPAHMLSRPIQKGHHRVTFRRSRLERRTRRVASEQRGCALARLGGRRESTPHVRSHPEFVPRGACRRRTECRSHTSSNPQVPQ